MTHLCMYASLLLMLKLIVAAAEHSRATHIRSAYTYPQSESICSVSGLSTCYDCLANNTMVAGNMTWCTKPEFCFLEDGSENAETCLDKCSGGYYVDGELGKCDDSAYTVGAVIVSFMLLVLCPLCLACGCCYVMVVRCRNMVDNKIAADNTAAVFGGSSVPIPLLQVYRTEEDAQMQSQAHMQVLVQPSSSGRHIPAVDIGHEASFVLAEARVAAEDDQCLAVDAEVGVAVVRQVGTGTGTGTRLRPWNNSPQTQAYVPTRQQQAGAEPVLVAASPAPRSTISNVANGRIYSVGRS